MPAILIDINLVWQIINFCVIMFIFKKKLFGPVSRIISERKALITKDMDDAKKDKEEAEKSKVKAEAELKKAKAEALKILVEAEKKSEERKDAILKDAHAQREKMIKSGEAEVEKQKEIADYLFKLALLDQHMLQGEGLHDFVKKSLERV